MKQEDIDLLFKDLCARLPYGVKVKFAGYSGREDCTLNVQHLSSTYNIEYLRMKPYLRSLSSMTDEEKKEMHHDCYIVSIDFDRRTTDMVAVPNSTKIVDWLNAHHFDYRHLIEKNLAIEVTEENNPYKN